MSIRNQLYRIAVSLGQAPRHLSWGALVFRSGPPPVAKRARRGCLRGNPSSTAARPGCIDDPRPSASRMGVWIYTIPQSGRTHRTQDNGRFYPPIPSCAFARMAPAMEAPHRENATPILTPAHAWPWRPLSLPSFRIYVVEARYISTCRVNKWRLGWGARDATLVRFAYLVARARRSYTSQIYPD